jgi:hypothetical protein
MPAMNRPVALLLVVLCFAGGAQGSDQWKGLWQIITYSGDQPGSVYHLAISGATRDDVTVYNEIGKSLDFSDFSLSQESIRLVIAAAPKPLPTTIEIQREDQVLSGKWVFFHPQYGEETGRLTGRRVLELAPDWKPFARLQGEQDDPLIDLTAPLGKVEEMADFPEFMEHWNKQVEPDYYFLFYQHLHPNSGEVETKPAELAKVFESLRDPQVASLWQSWKTDLARHVKAAKALLPVYSSPFYVLRPVGPPVERVELWSKFLSETDKSRLCCSMVPFLDQEYLVFNPLNWPVSEETKLLVGKEVVLSLFPAADGESAAEEIFRQGLALQIAREINESPAPACSPERIQQLKKAYGALSTQNRLAIVSSFAPGINPETPGFQLAIDFVRSLSSERDRAELMALTGAEIVAALAAYLAD